ncbi:MAG: hypothetical protein AAF485_00460 [Chloroflexota bacterium]
MIKIPDIYSDWPIVIGQHLTCREDTLWQLLKQPKHLELFHPFVDKIEVTQWPGDGAHDFVHYLSGLVLERRIKRWEDTNLTILILQGGRENTDVLWHSQPHDDTTVDLWIGLRPLWSSTVSVKPRLEQYLSGVLKGLAYYVETGQPVQPNQFGKVSVFS